MTPSSYGIRDVLLVANVRRRSAPVAVHPRDCDPDFLGPFARPDQSIWKMGDLV